MTDLSTTTLDFLYVAGLWSLASPLLVSVLKNLGGSWSLGAKQFSAVAMAVLGSVFAFGLSAGWESIALNDLDGFWKPLVIGVSGIFATQYAAYQAIWNGTKINSVAESIGVKSE